MASSKQRVSVDRRLEATCLAAAKQDTYRGVVVNLHSAIRLAFVLGVRAALAHPHIMGAYMGRYITDHTLESDSEDVGVRHQHAMHVIVQPLMYTADEFEHISEEEVTDEGTSYSEDEH